jgi:hypothetical protein
MANTKKNTAKKRTTKAKGAKGVRRGGSSRKTA